MATVMPVDHAEELAARERKLASDRAHLRERQVRVMNRLLEHAEAGVDRLREAYLAWQMPTRSSELDRLRGPLTTPFVSTAQDRRHGHNAPFWRSWTEHARTRAAGRLLVGLSGIADGMIRGLGSYVVGTGFDYTATARPRRTPPAGLIDAVQDIINEFVDRNYWAGQEIEGFSRSRRDGELFHLHEEPVGGTGYLEVSVIEPEEVVERVGETNDASYGVKTAGRRTDRPLGFYVAYDGDVLAPQYYESGDVIQLKINVDGRVKRGLTDFCYDLHDTVRTAGRLIDHVGQGAAIQASLAIIREHEAASVSQVRDFAAASAAVERSLGDGTGRTQLEEDYYPGKVLDLKDGTRFVDPPSAANMPGYMQVAGGLLRSVAVKWNAPEWLASADASNNNFASSIVAESPFVNRCYQERACYQRFYLRSVRAAVAVAAAAGRVVIAGKVWTVEEIFAELDITARAPNIEVRDEAKTAQTDQIYVDLGVKSRQTVRQELDLDDGQETANILAWGAANPQQSPQSPRQPVQPATKPAPPAAGMATTERPEGAS